MAVHELPDQLDPADLAGLLRKAAQDVDAGHYPDARGAVLVITTGTAISNVLALGPAMDTERTAGVLVLAIGRLQR